MFWLTVLSIGIGLAVVAFLVAAALFLVLEFLDDGGLP